MPIDDRVVDVVTPRGAIDASDWRSRAEGHHPGN
jgi:hypothetical protein